MALSGCGVETNEQGRELRKHGTALLPIACYHNDLDAVEVPWHWHDELEAVVVTEGSVVVAAGTERFRAKQGEGFFINAGVLHAAWKDGSGGCRFHSVVFHPRLVGGGLDNVFWQKYIQPLIADAGRKSFHFGSEEPWHCQAVQAVEAAWKSCVGEPPGYEFEVRGALSRLVFLLDSHCPAASRMPSKRALREERRSKQMLQFIQENYASDLDTAAIAASAAISESECLRCFRGTIGTPPMQYVKAFRLQKAAELLDGTALGVAEIGAQCGFPDASYFTKTFREWKGCSPSAYRQRYAQARQG